MPAEKLAFPGRNYLYAPGPTHIPVAVQNAMVVPMEDHRAPDFPQLVKPILRDLNKIFQTKSGQSFVFPATGTAGWEVALTNTLSPGDRVLTARFGQFSHLWADLAERMGLDVQLEQVTWGEGVPVERFRDILRADKGHRIKAVLVCHNETATGVTSDVAALRRAMDRIKHPALLMVDGVSSIASIDFRMDAWKVDVAVSGSQKGFMLPAGMAMVCFSKRALAAAKKAKCKRCFLDIADHIATNRDGFFPYTPSAPMLRGLRASLDLLLGEGLPNVFRRHRRLAEGVRRAVLDGWKLDLCATEPKWYSDTVSAIRTPRGVNAAEVIHIAYHRYNISLGAGLSEVAGKVFRIGHLGDNNEVRMLAALGGVEMAMRDAGMKVRPGSGVAKAVEYYCDTARPIRAMGGRGSRDTVAKKAAPKKAAAPKRKR